MFQAKDEMENAVKMLASENNTKESIDKLIYTAVFSPDETLRSTTRKAIREVAKEHHIVPSSINSFYRSIAKKEGATFTVPAVNIRALTYDTARCIFRLMMEHKVGPVVFEIARSEMEYTLQRPDEYSAVVLAAALREGYSGPVFIQGDHFQFSAKKFHDDSNAELQKIKDLTKEAIHAEFYNIDIDASTLVDLSKINLDEQQKNNYAMTAEMTKFIREIQPASIVVSIGGEIGHIGGKNSTVEDFEAFMKGYNAIIHEEGISKVSVQTGTSHGGTPDKSGKIIDVRLDFSVLEQIGNVAREKYNMGGAVQHGASTLPNDLFHRFPEVHTVEIHLATGLQNIVYNHLPQSLKEEMYIWCKEHLTTEREADWTDDQFIYKTRKKALGPFKQKMWDLSLEQKNIVVSALEEQMLLLFTQLNVMNTRDELMNYY